MGEVIPSQEASRRAGVYSRDTVEHVADAFQRWDDDEAATARAAMPPGDVFMFRLDGAWVVDGTVAGSLARFINHSCNPNAEVKIVDGIGDARHVCFFATREIGSGEEVTVDYGIVEGPDTAEIMCKCGAQGCTGRIDKPR